MVGGDTAHQPVHRLQHGQHARQVPAGEELIRFREHRSQAQGTVVEELQAAGFSRQRPAQQAASFLHLRLGAIKSARSVPDANLQLVAQFRHQGTAQRGLLVRLIPRVLPQRGDHLVVVGDMRGAANGAVQTQGAQGIDQGAQCRGIFAAEVVCLEVFGRGHEPHGHAGNHAKIGLREQAVEHRSDAPAVDRRGMRTGKAGESGFDGFSGREHDLQAAGMGEMVAIGRVAEAPLDGVSDEAGLGAGTGCIHPEPRPLLLQECIQLFLRDPRLQGDVGQFLVEIEDPVHAAQVEHDRATRNRDTGPVSPILAGTNGIDRNPKAIGHAKTLPHFGSIGGTNDGGDAAPGLKGGGFGFAERGRGGDDVIRANGRGPFRQSGIEK